MLTHLSATGNMNNLKKSSYDQCIREVKHTTLTSLVLATNGGKGSQYLLQETCLPSRNEVEQSLQLHTIQTELETILISLSLLRSAVKCITGAHSKGGHNFLATHIPRSGDIGVEPVCTCINFFFQYTHMSPIYTHAFNLSVKIRKERKRHFVCVLTLLNN